MLLPGAMLMSVVYVAVRGHVGVCGTYYQQRTCGYLWPGLLPEAMLMSVVRVATGSHVGVRGLC